MAEIKPFDRVEQAPARSDHPRARALENLNPDV
jgi:hypothetical protein